ncbi:ABC-2 family transporter protein [Gimesia panareensis]|uniref:ABC-2 family transporter protein n=1 Tax=Gimesia panareensis TaxID=2527978 RepID=A0A518FQL5_9PLAN|nr:hypothetical protein [Gimesia panareensis]QDV18646.1 ABC-2 family transporter protein [Gimesia panareensis]
MIALLWKEYRLNRDLFICGGMFLIFPYFMVWFALSYTEIWNDMTATTAWILFWESAAYISLFASQATITLLSAFMIARERADGSAEFLAYLPPSRLMTITVKMGLILITIAIIWSSGLTVYAIANSMREGIEDKSFSLIEGLPSFPLIAVLGGVWGGAAFFVSSFSKSPAIAIISAFPAPLIIYFLLFLIVYFFSYPETLSEFFEFYITICFGIAQIMYGLGIYCYVRRIRP